MERGSAAPLRRRSWGAARRRGAARGERVCLFGCSQGCIIHPPRRPGQGFFRTGRPRARPSRAPRGPFRPPPVYLLRSRRRCPRRPQSAPHAASSWMPDPRPAAAAAAAAAAAETEEFHDDIIYPSTIPFLLVHLACFAAIWTGVTVEALVICVAL